MSQDGLENESLFDDDYVDTSIYEFVRELNKLDDTARDFIANGDPRHKEAVKALISYGARGFDKRGRALNIVLPSDPCPYIDPTDKKQLTCDVDSGVGFYKKFPINRHKEIELFLAPDHDRHSLNDDLHLRYNLTRVSGFDAYHMLLLMFLFDQ